VRAIGTLHGAQVDRRRPAGEDHARGRRRVPRQPQVAGQQVSRPAWDEAERNSTVHRPGGDLHRRAVAAVADQGVEALLGRLAREAARVPRLGRGADLDRPAAAPQRVADRRHRPGIGTRRRRVGDEQGPRHG